MHTSSKSSCEIIPRLSRCQNTTTQPHSRTDHLNFVYTDICAWIWPNQSRWSDNTWPRWVMPLMISERMVILCPWRQYHPQYCSRVFQSRTARPWNIIDRTRRDSIWLGRWQDPMRTKPCSIDSKYVVHLVCLESSPLSGLPKIYQADYHE